MTLNVENDALDCDALFSRKQTAHRAMSMVFMLTAVRTSGSTFRKSYVSQIEREHASQNSIHDNSKLHKLRLQYAANMLCVQNWATSIA
jgi:hypothetical protein